MFNPFLNPPALTARLLLGALSLAPVLSHGADVHNYLLAKGQGFSQNTTNVQLWAAEQKPYRFLASVSPSQSNSVGAASLRLPNAQSRSLSNVLEGLEFRQGFTNKAQLDAAYGLGSYTFSLQTALDGLRQPSLSLPADAYPTVPQLLNLSDAQQLEAGLPASLGWAPFTNGTPADFILLEVSDLPGNLLWQSPALLEATALGGTNLAATLPAGVLEPGQSYQGRLLFFKRSSLNTNAYAGAVGLAGFFRETHFSLGTLGPAPAAGRIQFSSRNFSATEGASAALVSIQRAGVQGAISVRLATSDGTAKAGLDYQALDSTFTLAAGVSQTNVSIPLLNNYRLDGTRTINLTLSGASGGAQLGSRTNAVLSILDNEKALAGTLQFSPSIYAVSEAGRVANLKISRSGGSAGALSASFHTLDGSARAGEDYVATNGTLVLAAGQLSAQLPISILEDSLDETNETFFVQLDSVEGGAALGTNLTATVAIVDNDSGGTIAFSAPSYSTNENAGLLRVTVNRVGGSASGVSVDYATQDGTAKAGSDYVTLNGTLSFAAGESSKSLQVILLNDSLPENDETFSLKLFNVRGGAQLGALTNALLRIVDDESSLSFTNAVYGVSESGPTLAVNVVRSGAKNTSVSVSYSLVSGTAVVSNDFSGTGGTLLFGPNVGFKTILIPIINDTLAEGTQSFQVKLSNPQGGVQLGALSTTTVNILDNDSAGVIEFSSASYSVSEGAGHALITVRRTGGLASGVSVHCATVSGGTATAGTDYEPLSTNLVFEAGELSKSLSIGVMADPLTEPTETILLKLSNPSGGASLGALSSATLSVADKPDANAVPLAGPVFFAATINGKAVNTSSVQAVYDEAGGTPRLANFVASVPALPIRLFNMIASPLAVGVLAIDNSGNHGLMSYTEASGTSGRSWAVADGIGSVGSGGTLTIDGLDKATKTISGRFNFKAREITEHNDGGFITATGKFRVRWF